MLHRYLSLHHKFTFAWCGDISVMNKANLCLIASWLWYIYSASPWHNLRDVFMFRRAACLYFIFKLSADLFRLLGLMERRQNIPQPDCCEAAEHQEPGRNKLMLVSASHTFLRVLGKVFSLSSAQSLQSKKQGDFWGLSPDTYPGYYLQLGDFL